MVGSALGFCSAFPFGLDGVASSFTLSSAGVIFMGAPFYFFISGSAFVGLLPSNFVKTLNRIKAMRPRSTFASWVAGKIFPLLRGVGLALARNIFSSNVVPESVILFRGGVLNFSYPATTGLRYGDGGGVVFLVWLGWRWLSPGLIAGVGLWVFGVVGRSVGG